MPPRKRLDTDASPQEQPCPEHFPDGWPDDASAVGCEHGSWSLDGQTS
jgi:hypothetical protein